MTQPLAESLAVLGRAIEPLLVAREPGVFVHARNLFRRLETRRPKMRHVLDGIRSPVASLLAALDRLAPRYDTERAAILTAWAEVERASPD